MENAIELRKVNKIYRVPSIMPWKRAARAEALREASFVCPKGKITCLLGPNGAGKTTIIKILAGLVLPDGGDAAILGTSLADMKPAFRSRIGLATPNERSFYWRLTGYQNMSFYASLYGLKGKAKRERIARVLQEVAFEREEVVKPYRIYSSGRRQKLLIARALLGDPEILLLDEPTNHLDPLTKVALLRFVKGYLVGQLGKSVLLCTHDLNEAQVIADHLVLLHQGKVLAEGSLQELRSKLEHSQRIVLEFDTIPDDGWLDGLPAKLLKAEGVRMLVDLQGKNMVQDLIDAASAKGGRLLSCVRHEEPLMEIFVRLTTEQNQ